MKYIKIDETFNGTLSQIDSIFSQIEVKGESVRYLYQGRMLIKQLLENQIDEEEIINPKKEDKED